MNNPKLPASTPVAPDSSGACKPINKPVVILAKKPVYTNPEAI